MIVERWGRRLRLFHRNPQHPQQGHGQRFGAIGVAFLRGKRLNSLQDLNAHAWAKDGMRLLGAKRASFGQKIPKLCALQVIDLIWGTRLIV